MKKVKRLAKLEDGSIVYYDICISLDSDISYPALEKHYTYIGKGVIHSINNEIQKGSPTLQKFRFYIRKKS